MKTLFKLFDLCLFLDILYLEVYYLYNYINDYMYKLICTNLNYYDEQILKFNYPIVVISFTILIIITFILLSIDMQERISFSNKLYNKISEKR